MPLKNCLLLCWIFLPFILSACTPRSTVLKEATETPLVTSTMNSPSGIARGGGQLSRLWQMGLPGYLTDLDINPEGSLILVATAPDQDRGEANSYALTLLRRNGKVLWRLPWKKPIRSQALSSDGSLVVASNYESQVLAYSQDGQMRWMIEEMCRPLFLHPKGQPRQLICFHDDDAGAEIAIDWLDEKTGKKIRNYPTEVDVLALKLSPDHGAIGLSLNRGRYTLLSPEGRVLREGEIQGEIIDFTVGPGPEFRTAILYQAKGDKKKRRVLRFSLSKSSQPEDFLAPDDRALSIAQSGGGKILATYSNSSQGQWLSIWSGVAVDRIRLGAGEAEFHSSVVEFENLFLAGLDNSKLVAVDFAETRGVSWEIPIQTEEGSMLYTFSASAPTSVLGRQGSPALLVLASDDGKIQAWEWSRSPVAE